jgi:GNAT superfamily N-acetyltransferase
VTVDGPRSARPDELTEVIGLVDAAMRQGSDQTLRTDYPLVYAPENLANVHVVAVDGRVVATAPVLPRAIRLVEGGPTIRIGIISPTATDPAHQHRGYGSACVAACIARMEQTGVELSVLWTMVATFPFYELNGYQAIRPDLESIGLTADDATAFRTTGDLAVHELDVGDRTVLEAIRALHEDDGPGIVRAPEDWPRLLALPKMRTLVARRGARVVGYLVDSRASNKPGILEAGGWPWAIEALLARALADRPPGTPVPVAVLRTDHVLRRVLAERLGGALAERSTPGGHTMVRINDPKGVWRAIGQTGSPPPVTRPALAAAIFGPHPERWIPRPESMVHGFPIPLPIPMLDHS